MNEDASSVITTTGSVFGIDLGTTFSSIAYLDPTLNAQTISNTRSSKVTPSVVYIEELGEEELKKPESERKTPEILIGEAALGKEADQPDSIHRLFKRRMGEPNANVTVNGQPWSPTMFSSELLKGMVKDAKMAGFDVHDVVITHPAYFSPVEVEATQQAGKDAGLNVISVLPEPVAAALFYGIHKMGQTRTIAVYDLGGGTFDATLVRINENKFEVLDFAGRKTLGGADWDERIVNWCLNQVVEETGCSREDITGDSEVMAELKAKATQAKIELSDAESTKIVFADANGRHKIELSREKFEELTADHLAETREMMQKLLKRAKDGNLENHKGEHIDMVDDFLVVGGSTKMPQVMRMIKESFAQYCRNEPMFCDVNESVAKGAAIKALATGLQKGTIDESGFGELPPVTQGELETIRDIKTETLATRSFGVRARKWSEKEQAKVLYIDNLIKMKATLPAEGDGRFQLDRASGPDGCKLEIRVFSSEIAEAEIYDFNEKSVRELRQPSGEVLTVDVPPNLEKGSPIKIRFALSDQGILDIHYVDEKGNEFNGKIDTNE